MKKMFSLALALIMALALCVPAMAQDVGTDAADKATVTISNAAKGETYSVYKLFDATVTGTENGSIAYTGNIPESLAAYFTKDGAGNISATAVAKDGEKMSEGLQTALAAWAKGQTATASVESDGSVLNFNGLDYGYYVITTSQGEQTISVDSTNPDVTIVDKNSTSASELKKTSTDGDEADGYKIGDTVTYTVSFNTSNYYGDGTAAKKIVSYTIVDTLPDYLSNVNVTSIKVGETVLAVQQFDDAGKIVIPWVDADGTSLYDNKAKVEITYTAVVNEKAAVAGEGNTNTVTVTWQDKDGDLPGYMEDSDTIYTYGLALMKVNDKGEALAGATFKLPFFVKKTLANDGAYIYAGATKAEGDDTVTDELTTLASGEIVIKGVQNEEYSIEEAVAPDGYNKLTAPVKVTPEKLTTTTTTVTQYLDAQGNVVDEQTEVKVEYANEKLAVTPVFVVNMTGTELPSTGGIGTTIFYTVGGLMMAAAVVLFITKKKLVVEE